MVPFLIGTVAVVLMFQANFLIYILKTFSLGNIPPLALAQIILLKTPSFLNLTLPVGMALAASLAMSRLARESEITAMRAAGAPYRRILIPAVLFGVFSAGLNFFLAERVMPPAEVSSRKLMQEVAILAAAPSDFRSNLTLNLKRYSVNIGLVTRADGGDGLDLHRVIIYERPDVDSTWIWRAESGTYRRGVWRLGNAEDFVIKKGELSQWQPGKEEGINEPIVVDNIMGDALPEGQTLTQLQATIDEAKRVGRDTTEMEVAFHTRYSLPASCIIFALLGPLFAIRLAPRGAFVGVFLSVIIVMLYYNAFVVTTQVFAPNHWTPPAVAAWLPNIIFGLIGLIYLRKLE